MWDFDIGRTLGIMARTWPFIALRLIVYFGITLAYVLATGTGATRRDTTMKRTTAAVAIPSPIR